MCKIIFQNKKSRVLPGFLVTTFSYAFLLKEQKQVVGRTDGIKLPFSWPSCGRAKWHRLTQLGDS